MTRLPNPPICLAGTQANIDPLPKQPSYLANYKLTKTLTDLIFGFNI